MNIQPLIDWYNTLSPSTISQVDQLYHEQASFRDPFNDVKGQEAIAAIFQHMFETTEQPRFRVLDVQQEGSIAWVSWLFLFGFRGKAVTIEGTTRLDFATDGRVLKHRDYWDATDLYIQLPLLGGILTFIQRRMRVVVAGN